LASDYSDRLLVDLGEDFGHLRRGVGAHGVSVNVALLENVDVEGGRRIFVFRLADREKVVLALQPERLLILIPAFAAALVAASTRFGASLMFLMPCSVYRE
jgi:hypothetical protein